MNLNQATLAGRVCQTPELKALPSGVQVVSFSLAINSYWTDKNTNEKKESVTFIPIVFFGKQGETIAQYVVKGQALLVVGRIDIQSYEDKEGVKKWATKVIGETFQFGSAPSDAGEKRTGAQKAQGVPARKKPQSDQEHAEKQIHDLEYPEEEINPDDIPF